MNKTIAREIYFICAWVLALSALMQAVFIIIGKWDYTVLLGNLVSGACSILNFFFLGVSVQRAITSRDEGQVRALMRLSQALRLLLVLCVAILGATVSHFNLWATLIPIFFVRIAISLRPLFNSKMGVMSNMTLDNNEEGEQSERG